jgi:hypothetical protein
MPNQDNPHGAPRGGHELPPEVQDRPEQNRGYDEAAHGRADEERRVDPVADDERDRGGEPDEDDR